jgi:hypothetical protein
VTGSETKDAIAERETGNRWQSEMGRRWEKYAGVAVKRQCAPLVASGADEKRSSTADYVKGAWHLSRVWVSRAAVEKNGWRAVSRRDSKRKQSRYADRHPAEHWEQGFQPRHDESVSCAACGRVIWAGDVQRLGAAVERRMTREEE